MAAPQEGRVVQPREGDRVGARLRHTGIRGRSADGDDRLKEGREPAPCASRLLAAALAASSSAIAEKKPDDRCSL
jgi:hypothetical protein